MKPLKIIYKYASRSRPENFYRGLDSIIKLSNNKKDYMVLCTLDENDPKAEEYKAGQIRYLEHNVVFLYGSSKGKIDAVNRDLDLLGADWDILVNFSDDMVFNVQGFDDLIRKGMEQNFPDTDGFLHFHDGVAGFDIATMNICGRKYFERFGYIYHPAYWSLWADNEAMDVAKLLGKYWFAGPNSIIYSHLHPFNGNAKWDAQYKEQDNNKVYLADKKVYEERKAKNFDLPITEIHKDANAGQGPILSILVCTTRKTWQYWLKLKAALDAQISRVAPGAVELIANGNEGSIGQKRNQLLNQATGKYICFFDDDDTPSQTYVAKILKALEQEPDCVSLTGLYYKDGVFQRPFYHSLAYNRYYDDADGYYRFPNHLNPVKAEIAKQFKFPETNHGEDTEYATIRYRSGLLKTEVVIPEAIYYYKYRTNK